MKRYLAFYGQTYYPSEGMSDFISDLDTLEESIEAIERVNIKEDQGEWAYNWGIVWDSKEKVQVWKKQT